MPAAYIGETRLRIDFYRRLALADTPRPRQGRSRPSCATGSASFGDEVRALLLVTEIRIRAEQKGIVSVETRIAAA